MVQNFTVFMDKVVTAKIKTTKFLINGENYDIIVYKHYANTPRGRKGLAKVTFN